MSIDTDGHEQDDLSGNDDRDPVSDTCKALALATIVCQARLDSAVPWAAKAARSKFDLRTLLSRVDHTFVDRLCGTVMSPAFRGSGMSEVRVSLFRMFCQAVYVFNYALYNPDLSRNCLGRAMQQLDQKKTPVDRAIDVLKWRDETNVTLAIARIVAEIAVPTKPTDTADPVAKKIHEELMFKAIPEEQHPCLTLDPAGAVAHSQQDHAACQRYKVPSHQMVIEIEARYYARMQHTMCCLVQAKPRVVNTTLTNEIIRLFIRANATCLKPLFLDIAGLYVSYKFPSDSVALLGERLVSCAPRLIHKEWNGLIAKFKTDPLEMLKNIAKGDVEPWLEGMFVLCAFANAVKELHQIDIDFTTLAAVQDAIDKTARKSPDACLILVSDEVYYIYQTPAEVAASEADVGANEEDDGDDDDCCSSVSDDRTSVWVLETLRSQKRRRIEPTPTQAMPSTGRFIPVATAYDAIRFWISAKQPRGLLQKLAHMHARDAVDNHRETDRTDYLTILNSMQ